MHQISVRSITLEHFKSFAKQTTVDLDVDGFVLVAGDNRLEPSLGANGAGKSSLFDALCYALYGSSVHGIRAGDLLSPNTKRLSVSVIVDVDGRDITITRSGPPARLLIDDSPSEQGDVDRLVGLTRDRFLSSVLFGQGMPLFIDMSAPERGTLLDDVLDLGLWMRVSDRAGKTQSATEAELGRLRIELGRAEGALSSLESPEDIVAREAAWEATRTARIEDMISEVANYEAAIGSAEAELANLAILPDPEILYAEYRALDKRKVALAEEHAVLASKLDKAEEETAFFEENDICPVCTQSITAKHAERCRTQLIEIRDELAAQLQTLDEKQGDAAETANTIHAQWQAARRKYEEANTKATRLRVQIESAQNTISLLERRINATADEANPHAAQRERIEAERERLAAILHDLVLQEQGLKNRLASLDFWRQAFKRVRLFCIGRVLRELDIESMNAAAALGLVGWKIKHTTETETKSGTIRLGVQVAIESPTLAGPFHLWSGGEGQRVRLASALGLAGLVQRWSGVRWNIEIFDEPTVWLSEAGIEDLLSLLSARADMTRRRIFLADHRALTHAGFSRVMTVIKDEGGSHVEVL